MKTFYPLKSRTELHLVEVNNTLITLLILFQKEKPIGKASRQEWPPAPGIIAVDWRHSCLISAEDVQCYVEQVVQYSSFDSHLVGHLF